MKGWKNLEFGSFWKKGSKENERMEKDSTYKQYPKESRSIYTNIRKRLQSKIFIRDKEALYIFIQISIYQEDKTTVNIAKTWQNL